MFRMISSASKSTESVITSVSIYGEHLNPRNLRTGLCVEVNCAKVQVSQTHDYASGHVNI